MLRPPATITRADPADDFWYRWPGGWALYSLLSFDSGVNAAKLAALTGLSRRGVVERLGRLRKEGFASYNPQTYLWFKAGDDQPTTVEQKWGENRALRHEAERHAYDSTRARLAEEDAHLRSLSPAERKAYLQAKKRAKAQAKLRNLNEPKRQRARSARWAK